MESIKDWIKLKKRGILGVGLVTGLAWIGEHWLLYGKIDPTFGHEWIGWLMATVSMVLLAIDQKFFGSRPTVPRCEVCGRVLDCPYCSKEDEK